MASARGGLGVQGDTYTYTYNIWRAESSCTLESQFVLNLNVDTQRKNHDEIEYTRNQIPRPCVPKRVGSRDATRSCGRMRFL